MISRVENVDEAGTVDARGGLRTVHVKQSPLESDDDSGDNEGQLRSSRNT